MNSFLDLHSDADYRNTNRPYYTGTWEYINVASQYLIPFQFTSASSDVDISTIGTDGTETDISYMFGSELITGWTKTGTGVLNTTGSTINSWNYFPTDLIVSNDFALTIGDPFLFQIDTSKWDLQSDVIVQFRNSTTILDSFYLDADTRLEYIAPTTNTTYNIRIINTSGLTDGNCTSNTPHGGVSSLANSGNYYWYNGGLLNGTLSGVFYLKVVADGATYYSDWCDVCGFTDKTKITLSSSYDYGGIKYVDGYEQWMYKNATVRRSPKAEIEITGDKLNGAIIEEKKVAAIRYKITMKCTESEYEGLVHAMGGTLTITDQTGKSYTAVNIELTDPSWYKANGIVELSFVDSANINIYTRNNTDL